MLPDFDEYGNLPPGIHLATYDEVAARFGGSPERQELLAGLGRALALLEVVGCRRVWLDGSFITDKERIVETAPGDYDLAWDVDGVDLGELLRRDPALDPLRWDGASQRLRFRGDGTIRDRDGCPLSS